MAFRFCGNFLRGVRFAVLAILFLVFVAEADINIPLIVPLHQPSTALREAVLEILRYVYLARRVGIAPHILSEPRQRLIICLSIVPGHVPLDRGLTEIVRLELERLYLFEVAIERRLRMHHGFIRILVVALSVVLPARVLVLLALEIVHAANGFLLLLRYEHVGYLPQLPQIEVDFARRTLPRLVLEDDGCRRWRDLTREHFYT